MLGDGSTCDHIYTVHVDVEQAREGSESIATMRIIAWILEENRVRTYTGLPEASRTQKSEQSSTSSSHSKHWPRDSRSRS